MAIKQNNAVYFGMALNIVKRLVRYQPLNDIINS